ncbi:MAG: hypothetical protein ABSG84_05295 [Acidobacteriaceae bacterium]|jgi:hypothetical protein
MATLRDKIARLEAANKLLESLVARGVDLKSEEAIPHELELLHAFDDLAQEFGHKILKPL